MQRRGTNPDGDAVLSADMLKSECVVMMLLLFVKGSLSQTDVCGRTPLNDRIVGGNNASEGAWPWQVSLQLFGNHFCGGTLINKQWIMTAAHCVSWVKRYRNYLVAYLGKQTLEGSNPEETKIRVSKVHIHPKYSQFTYDNDIALLQLKNSVTYTDYIRPVCLATKTSNFPAGTDCWITGWGDIAYGDWLPSPGVLQEAMVPVVDRNLCEDMLGLGLITDNMICAGFLEGGTDTCQGDSGGPMVTKQGGVWIQVGITSWGMGCAQARSPGVYTLVSQYESWISETIRKDLPGFVTYPTGP